MSTTKNPFLKVLHQHITLGDASKRANLIYYSEYKNIYSANTFRSVGIKYVSKGFEYYKVGKKEFKVNSGQYILSNPTPGVEGIVDSKEIVKGICVDIDPATLADAFNILVKQNAMDLDNQLVVNNPAPYFFEHVSHAGLSVLSRRLSILEKHLTSHNYGLPFVDDEWFLGITEELICEQNDKWISLNRLKNLKTSSRQEIMRRLLLGKEFMDVHYCNGVDIKSIAEFCCLSEFHFFRSFKDAFKTTPYQYMLNKKLIKAFELLREKKSNITDVAIALNFTDVHAFSNAFKKRFGYAPSKLLN